MADIKSDKNILEELIGGIKQATGPGNEEKMMEKVTSLQRAKNHRR